MLVLCVLLLTLLFAFCFTVYNKLFINYQLRWVYGFSISLTLFMLGVFIVAINWSAPSALLEHEGTKVEMIGTVSEPPEVKAKSLQCILQLEGIKRNGQFVGCKDRIMIYVHKDTSALTIKAGDMLICKSSLATIRSSGNPYEFDYKKYMSYQGIYYSGYVDAQAWKRLSAGNLFVIKKWAYDLRSKLLAVFPNLGMTGEELGVASALIVGDKAALDKDIKRAYVASGTMHILAVSGMHIALLFWALNVCLFFLDHVKHGRYLKLFILLLAVWLYAMITGLSGSVLRAATMITFVIIGQSLRQEVNIFNSLAASAFLLLLINPFNLTDVGFQLSYVAVLSIVVFFPLLYKLAEFNSWVGNQLWSLVAVTLAAQILTTPVSLYYFHQFPNLFLVSNLLMIPLSTVIMYSAMAILPFAGVHWMMAWMGKVFNAMVWLLNQIVLTIEGLPYSLTKGIYITGFQVCLLYVFVVAMALYLVMKRVRFLLVGIGVVLILLTQSLIEKYINNHQHEMLIYNDKDNLIIQFRNGSSSVWLVDSTCEHLNRYIQVASEAMHSRYNLVVRMDSIQLASKNIGNTLIPGVWVKGNYIQFHDKRIVITNGKERNTKGIAIGVDYAVVRGAHPLSLHALSNCYAAKVVVIPAAVSGYTAKHLEKSYQDVKVTTYNIANSGALRVKL